MKGNGIVRVAVVDDDIHFLKIFIKYLDNYFPNYFDTYELCCISSDYYKNLMLNNYDIIFIDIDLQNETGINIVFSIKKNYSNCIFIFVSSKNDMVFDALCVQPFQFIRKSNLLEDLLLTLSLLDNYYKEHAQLITLDFHGRKTSIKIRDIVYIQSDIHEISIITKKDCYTYRSTLKNILSTINNKSLVQIQKSLVINLDYVKEINENYDVILKNGNIFAVNRYYRKNFIVKYKEYLLL